jgi:hypothetical protein
MNPADQPTSTDSMDTGGVSAGTTSTGQGGDMLDKGVNFVEQRSGHEQKPATTEKVVAE